MSRIKVPPHQRKEIMVIFFLHLLFTLLQIVKIILLLIICEFVKSILANESLSLIYCNMSFTKNSWFILVFLNVASHPSTLKIFLGYIRIFEKKSGRQKFSRVHLLFSDSFYFDTRRNNLKLDREPMRPGLQQRLSYTQTKGNFNWSTTMC